MTNTEFKAIAEVLLGKHYGLTLNDTPFCEDREVGMYIKNGTEPYEIIKDFAEECDLVRFDIEAHYGVHSRDPITAQHQADAVVRVGENSEIEKFLETSPLLPSIVLDSVVREVSDFLGDNRKTYEMCQVLHGDEMTHSVSLRTARSAEGDNALAKALKTADPRPAYESFMRHWVSAEMKKSFSAEFDRLPAGFSNGEPLPNEKSPGTRKKP